jgi:hypothetical protein
MFLENVFGTWHLIGCFGFASLVVVNRKFAAGQIADILEKLEQVGGAVGCGVVFGGFHAGVLMQIPLVLTC